MVNLLFNIYGSLYNPMVKTMIVFSVWEIGDSIAGSLSQNGILERYTQGT
jgi:hypothetical protein